jgi:hypothetical protein
MSNKKNVLPDVKAYPDVAYDSVVNVPSNKQLALFTAKVTNKSGSAIDLGLLVKLATTRWQFYTIVGGTATNATSAIQSGATTTIDTTTIGDGFLFACDKLFGLVGLLVSQAPTGAPVYTYQYYNGTTWATLTTLAVPAYGTGKNYIVFMPPIDWVPGFTTYTGLTQTQYTIRMVTTTAPTQAIQVANASGSSVWSGQFLDYLPAVANNGQIICTYPQTRPIWFEGGEGLMPYFGTANSANVVMVDYAILD